VRISSSSSSSSGTVVSANPSEQPVSRDVSLRRTELASDSAALVVSPPHVAWLRAADNYVTLAPQVAASLMFAAQPPGSHLSLR